MHATHVYKVHLGYILLLNKHNGVARWANFVVHSTQLIYRIIETTSCVKHVLHLEQQA